MARQSVVIVGGGISGLAAAWELSGGAEGPNATTPRIEILESSPTVGGGLSRTRFAGRDVDQGPDGFLARRPEAVTLVDELGLHDELEAIGAQGAWLMLRGRLYPLPEGIALGVPTSAASLRSLRGLSWRARLNAWRDEHLPRRIDLGDDATIGEIVRTKLGDELAYKVVEPMIGGIQAGRIDELSALSVFPPLLSAARKGGSLMKALRPVGAINPGPSAPSNPGPAFYTLRTGVGSLPEELHRQLLARGVMIETSSRATALRRVHSSFYRWEVDTATTSTPANAVILATPPRVTAQLVGVLDDGFAKLADVESASAAMVTFCVARDKITLPATGTGVLVPLATPFGTNDTLMVTAITLLDRKWPHLYEDDTVVLRAHVGRSDDRRSLAMNDDELTARVAIELQIILGSFGPATASMVVRFNDALPQYRVGHTAMVERAKAAAGAHGLAVAGIAYDGVGIPASIGSGRRAAREVLALLKES